MRHIGSGAPLPTHRTPRRVRAAPGVAAHHHLLAQRPCRARERGAADLQALQQLSRRLAAGRAQQEQQTLIAAVCNDH
jgi:hypothetical protein